MKVYQVLLSKVESSHNNLRTRDVEGKTIELPEVGKNFSLVGESLTEGMNARLVTTTVIKEIEKIKDDYLIFKTQNSTYALKILGTVEGF